MSAEARKYRATISLKQFCQRVVALVWLVAARASAAREPWRSSDRSTLEGTSAGWDLSPRGCRWRERARGVFILRRRACRACRATRNAAQGRCRFHSHAPTCRCERGGDGGCDPLSFRLARPSAFMRFGKLAERPTCPQHISSRVTGRSFPSAFESEFLITAAVIEVDDSGRNQPGTSTPALLSARPELARYACLIPADSMSIDAQESCLRVSVIRSGFAPS